MALAMGKYLELLMTQQPARIRFFSSKPLSFNNLDWY
jgi:hypothetical protein